MKFSNVVTLVALLLFLSITLAFSKDAKVVEFNSETFDNTQNDFNEKKQKFLENTSKLMKTKKFDSFLQKFGVKLPNVGEQNETDDNSPIKCVTCVAALKIVENIADQHSGDITKAMELLCDWIKKPELQLVCKGFVTFFGPEIAKLLALGLPPDQTCEKIKFCNNPQCRLFTNNTPSNKYKVSDFKPLNGELKLMADSNKSWWDRIYEVFDKHIPLDDIDGDYSATLFGFRGSAWRGKDCNDLNKDIHPGRKIVPGTNGSIDYNCNGIYGSNPQTGKPWKEELCTVPQKGLVVLGDSASAHFIIPEQWMSKNVKMEDFQHAFEILENELDFPHTSMYTGYTNDYTGLLQVNTSSIYMAMKEINRCIHRDFQNIAVNGARSGAMIEIAKTMYREQKNDHPLLVFLALIGNDVCSPHYTTNTFTPVDVFEKNIVTVLQNLDNVLPEGSTVVTVGLVQGEFLYNTMNNQTHPIGTTYKALYDYLNCLEINPCAAWLTSNDTMRHLATEHAQKLSAVYNKIISERTFKNFNVIYREFPLDQKLIDDFIHAGGKLKDLIAAIDGFHPSQLGHKLLAEYLVQDLSEKYPGIFGEVNPNNEKIKQLFGDQGGY